MKLMDAQIIIKLAENGLRVSESARQLYMSRTCVADHIGKIHDETGKNPLDFYDMCKLLPMAKAIVSKGDTYRD